MKASIRPSRIRRRGLEGRRDYAQGRNELVGRHNDKVVLRAVRDVTNEGMTYGDMYGGAHGAVESQTPLDSLNVMFA